MTSQKILFVDDKENILLGLQRLLRSKYEIETAIGASEGLDALNQRGPYAVIVSDLGMPEMNGIQFLEEVRKRAPDTIRLILSGTVNLEEMIASVNDGTIFQFIAKPCPPKRLREVLDAALKRYRLTRSEAEDIQYLPRVQS